MPHPSFQLKHNMYLYIKGENTLYNCLNWIVSITTPLVTYNNLSFIFYCSSSLQMAGSSAATQSMKKTIGHRGVETTTGETTYKKVRSVGTTLFTDRQTDRNVCIAYVKVKKD